VDATNAIIVDMLPGQQHTFYSCDEMKDFDDPDYRVPTEFLHSLTPSNTPPHELSLKVGTVVMIMRNLDQESGLQNGTRIQVTTIKEFAIQGIIITEGPFFKKPCIIPRIKFVIDDPTLFGFTFTRVQFPINVAFAMTIHKSEGQTLQQVGLYLPDPVFTHGMLYTALSRCTTRKGVTVLLGINQRPPDKHEGWYTANIVFRNVLIDE
jgi:ATP-dependent DNA helicase PIF1